MTTEPKMPPNEQWYRDLTRANAVTPASEPKMPPLPEPDCAYEDLEGDDVLCYSVEAVQALHRQWAERVAELERMLGDYVNRRDSYTGGVCFPSHAEGQIQ